MYLDVHIIGDCNLECKNCLSLVDFGYNKGYLIPLNEIQEIIKVAKKSNINVFILTGGEAIMHPNIEEICRLIIDSGFWIWLNTNGVLKSKLSDLSAKFPKLIIKDSNKKSSFQPQFLNFHFSVDDIKAIGGEVLSVLKPEDCKFSTRLFYYLGKYFMCCIGGEIDQLNNLNLGIEFHDEPINHKLLKEKQKLLCSYCGQNGIKFTNPNNIDISTLGKKWRERD
jgi:hypothetical protein